MKLYNSRIIRLFLKFVELHYPHVDTAELLSNSGIQPHETNDPAHWLTQQQVNRFYARLVAVTENPGIAREAGRFAASPNGVRGVLRQYFLSLGGVADTYALFSRFASRLTRSTDYEIRKLGPNRIEVCVTPRPNVKEEPFQCENRKGWIEGLWELNLGRPSAQLDHPECIFKSGKCCRYIVSWRTSLLGRVVTWTRYLIFAAAIAFVVGLFVFPATALKLILPVTLVALTSSVIASLTLSRRELRHRIQKMLHTSHGELERLDSEYNAAMLTAQIGEVVGRQRRVTGLIGASAEVLQQRLDFDRAMIWLREKDADRIVFRTAYGFTEEQLCLCHSTSFDLAALRGSSEFVQTLATGQPLLISQNRDTLPPKIATFFNALDGTSFICCPIIVDGNVEGILIVDRTDPERPVTLTDVNQMIGLSHILSISIHHAQLLEGRLKQFQSIIQVLAASIDARDPLTAGHSNDVASYAVAICNELGIASDEREAIRIAALLHDYGKIAVPDAILNKPGKLTPEEYQQVKIHSGKTREILSHVPFEGVFKDVPNIAAAHHERLDGSGYPLGLKGDAIPLGARIIAVADVYESMTAKRHYRAAVPHEDVVRIMREECATNRLDSTIVEALIRTVERSKDMD